MPQVIRTHVALVGEAQTGKTSLIQLVTSEGGSATRQQLPTMSPEVFVKRVKVPNTDFVVDLFVTDCPSNQIVATMTKRAMAECQLVLVVASYVSETSLTDVSRWIAAVKDATMGSSIAGVLCANFAYEGFESFTQEEAASVAEENGLQFAQCNVTMARDCDAPFLLLAQAACSLQANSGCSAE